MSSVYITTSIYQQKDSKKTTDYKELKQPNTKEELKKSSNHHLPRICRLELGFSAPRMFHRFHHRRCSQYGLWTTISKQNFPCIWCRTHWPNNLGTCLKLHILHGIRTEKEAHSTVNVPFWFGLDFTRAVSPISRDKHRFAAWQQKTKTH